MRSRAKTQTKLKRKTKAVLLIVKQMINEDIFICFVRYLSANFWFSMSFAKTKTENIVEFIFLCSLRIEYISDVTQS